MEKTVLAARKQFRSRTDFPRNRSLDDPRTCSGRYKRDDSYYSDNVFQPSKYDGRCSVRSSQGKAANWKGKKHHHQRAQNESVENQADKKKEKLSKETLLNFRYEREPATFDQRKARKCSYTPFSKEAFLQANCKFIVRMDGDYVEQLIDPDALVSWNCIEQVHLKIHGVINCPVCLYPPKASKITRCGHVYCWSCITHCLYVDKKTSCRCPICFQTVRQEDLKSVVVLSMHKFEIRDTMKMLLMKREKGSLIAKPFSNWHGSGNTIECWTGKKSESYSKVQLASAKNVLENILTKERAGLLQQMTLAEAEKTGEEFYIQCALTLLQEKERELLERSMQEDINEHTSGKESGSRHLKQSNSSNNSERECQSEFGLTQGKRQPVEKEQKGEEISTCIDDSRSQDASDLTRVTATRLKPEQFHYFYQADDGQDVFIHPINVQCLLKEYGTFDQCPFEVSGQIIDMQTFTMTPELRKRYRYISHLPLSCEFTICELILKYPVVSRETLSAFADAFQRRKEERQQKKKQQRRLERKMESKQTLDCHGRELPRRDKTQVKLDLESYEDFPSQLSPLDTLAGIPDADGNKSSPELKSNSRELSFSAALKTSKSPIVKSEIPLPDRMQSQQSNADTDEEGKSVPCGSDDEENEEYTTIPSFSQSFSDAIAASIDVLALETADTAKIEKNKKSKKKGKKILFSTGLSRISQ